MEEDSNIHILIVGGRGGNLKYTTQKNFKMFNHVSL